MKRIALALLLLTGCPPTTPSGTTQAQALGDNTCEGVAWSCVGMKPGTEEAWGCTEGTANERARYEATCTAEKHGRFALSPCPRDFVVGGCTLARQSTCVTTWLREPASMDDVTAECQRQGALVVTP